MSNIFLPLLRLKDIITRTNSGSKVSSLSLGCPKMSSQNVWPLFANAGDITTGDKGVRTTDGLMGVSPLAVNAVLNVGTADADVEGETVDGFLGGSIF